MVRSPLAQPLNGSLEPEGSESFVETFMLLPNSGRSAPTLDETLRAAEWPYPTTVSETHRGHPGRVARYFYSGQSSTRRAKSDTNMLLHGGNSMPIDPYAENNPRPPMGSSCRLQESGFFVPVGATCTEAELARGYSPVTHAAGWGHARVKLAGGQGRRGEADNTRAHGQRHGAQQAGPGELAGHEGAIRRTGANRHVGATHREVGPADLAQDAADVAALRPLELLLLLHELGKRAADGLGARPAVRR